LTTSANTAVVIDPANVGGQSVQRAWGKYLDKDKVLRYRYECLRTGLPAELELAMSQTKKNRVLVVACHACQHLSDEILEIACEKFGVAAAVMPCCQKDTSPGSSWKSVSKNLGIPIEIVMDLLLAGKAMSWNLSYDVRIKAIDGTITPQNRIVLCRPNIDSRGSEETVDKAHDQLTRAYRRAHDVKREKRTTRQITDY
jgi:hypothetical protein